MVKTSLSKEENLAIKWYIKTKYNKELADKHTKHVEGTGSQAPVEQVQEYADVPVGFAKRLRDEVRKGGDDEVNTRLAKIVVDWKDRPEVAAAMAAKEARVAAEAEAAAKKKSEGKPGNKPTTDASDKPVVNPAKAKEPEK